MNILAPSILSADFSDLGDAIRKVDKAGAQYIHIDVMDGIFVPSISFGMPVIRSIRKCTEKTFDVHLMIEDPDRYLRDFQEAGADIITVHMEAATHLDRTISAIKELGCKAAVSLNPSTSLTTLEYVLDKLDMVLIMSVNPGFGGQKYIDYCTGKISALRDLIEKRGLKTDIQVDGGITLGNVKTVLDAGANIIVSGSSVFNGDVNQNVKDFLDILNK